MPKKNIDFLDLRIVSRYLIWSSGLLLSGYFLKDLVALGIVGLMIYYVAGKKPFQAIEIWLVWFFIYGFFTGLSLITVPAISTYFAKPSFLLFILFVSLYASSNKKFNNILKSDAANIVSVYFLTVILGLLINLQLPFTAVTAISFFLLNFILRGSYFTGYQFKRLFNLFVSLGVLQTCISFLQVAQIIPPASAMMNSEGGGAFEWTAGLDDTATGTFGAVSSHLVSWYQSLLLVFLMLIWAITQKLKYFLIAGVCFIQFATTDSKIILGVSLLMLTYLIVVFFVRNSQLMRIDLGRIISIFGFVALLLFVLYQGWDAYYKYYSKNTGSEFRTDVKSVYKNEVQGSVSQMIDYIDEWGKIQGFKYVFNDFVKTGLETTLFGYGIKGYEYGGKAEYILMQDTPKMQLNNVTNSNSGLIALFATNGIMGVATFLYAISMWIRQNLIIKPKNSISIVNNGLLKIFLFFTILVAFLYPVSFTSTPVIAFSGLTGLLNNYFRYSKYRAILFKSWINAEKDEVQKPSVHDVHSK